MIISKIKMRKMQKQTENKNWLSDFIREKFPLEGKRLSQAVGSFDVNDPMDLLYGRNWFLHTPAFKEFIYPLMTPGAVDNYEGNRTENPTNPMQKPVDMEKLMETLEYNGLSFSITHADIVMPGDDYAELLPKVSRETKIGIIKDLKEQGYDFKPSMTFDETEPRIYHNRVKVLEWNKIPKLDDPRLLKTYQIASSVFPREGYGGLPSLVPNHQSIDWVTGGEMDDSNLEVWQKYDPNSGKVISYFDFSPSDRDLHNITHNLIPAKVIQLMRDCLIQEKRGEEK